MNCVERWWRETDLVYHGLLFSPSYVDCATLRQHSGVSCRKSINTYSSELCGFEVEDTKQYLLFMLRYGNE